MRWQRKDEIGSLADGLDHMRTDLRALLSERDQKNAALQYELVERQRTEQALGVIQAKFSAIFDASPVAMSVSSFGGEFTLLDVNSAWVRVFARVRSNALGQSGIKIGIWRDLAVRQKALDILLSTGELSAYPAWCKRGEGLTDIFCEISGKVIVLGSESLLILVFEDITAKHRYEENILSLNASLEQRVGDRTQELSSALSRLTAAQAELVRTEKMAALGSLVAGVAHELNTPIGNSLTVASTLQDQARAFAGEMARGLTRSRLDEYVTSTQDGADILMRGLRHAADLVSSFKQVAVDQTSANRRQFNLNEMVSEVLLTLGPSIRKTTHRVECSIPLDITLDSYPGPLGQVITNLINNALVHAFEGRERGTVSISAALQGSEQVLFLVRDDGVGIPEANIARVFDPFFTTKLGKGGSGLGLNIVFNLVQDVMGGSIQVESSNGQGSSFSIRVPRVAPVAASV
jgi:signal transduction histidine kinase